MKAKMRLGALAIIDILGFKGMWHRTVNPVDILLELDKIKSLANELLRHQNEMDGGDLWESLDAEVRVFSDCLMIVMPMPEDKNDYEEQNYKTFYEAIRKYMLLRYLVLIVTKIITEAVNGNVPFLYRGCISFGEFAFNDFAALGPAVDEAGSYFEKSEGAFVFLSPSAAEIYKARPGLLQKAIFPYFTNYNVPMKNEKTLQTFVMNPLLFIGINSNNDIKQQILDAFGNGELAIEVENKKRNTQEYLDFLVKTYPESWGSIG
jgi:hypothetical protein